MNPSIPENLSSADLPAGEAGPAQPELDRAVAPPGSVPQPTANQGLPATNPDPNLVAVNDANLQTSNQSPVNADSPAQAVDGDLIEPVWVEQADKIVATTKDDPRKEEAAAENLSQDYLKKRFGIDVTKS